MGDLNEAWARLESREGATALVAELGARGGLAGPELLLRGLARLDAGDAAGALADLDGVIAAQPENPVALAHRALALFLTGDAAAAGAAFRSGPLFPQGDFIRRFMAVFWPLRTRTGLAVAPTGEAMSDLPHGTDFARFQKLAGEGKDVPAKARARLATRLLEASFTEFEKGRVARFEALVERAAIVAPDHADAQVLWAGVLHGRGRGAEAVALVERAFSLTAETIGEHKEGEEMPPEVLACYGGALEAAGRPREALEVLWGVEPAGPDDWMAHFHAALAWLALGDEARYRSCLAVALGPFFIDTWEQQVRPFATRVIAWLGTEEAATVAREMAAAGATRGGAGT